MAKKYKCLVLDHDDTVVNSTATIHFPCFMQYLAEKKPHLVKNYTLESYFIKNFHPGVTSLFVDEIGLSKEELAEEEEYWANYVMGHIPVVYDGIKEIIEKFKSEGGIVAVDSHSYERYIRRDYNHNGLPTPDIIYGWDIPKEQRKPSPHTLFDLMERYKLSPDEILVVDDLKPGYDMARGAGVGFGAAGWAYDLPEIEGFMRKNCDYYFKTVKDFSDFLFGN